VCDFASYAHCASGVTVKPKAELVTMEPKTEKYGFLTTDRYGIIRNIEEKVDERYKGTVASGVCCRYESGVCRESE
ncbi:MAG: hypothetical protein NC131_21930, partial [Roseburia sp.]|nr:hypothetical protein [Roseburia sp.]